MKHENKQAKNIDSLRRKAEKQMALEDQSTLNLSPKEVQHTLHELRVHQIELEMQNEELRRVQVALEISRSRYFDLYDLAPVGYMTLSEKGIILEANLTSTSLLGYPGEELVNKPISNFILKEDQDIYYQYKNQLNKSSNQQTCELRMTKGDGTIIWIGLISKVVIDTDGVRRYRMGLNNITERKIAEENILKLNAELEQLALVDYLTGLNNRRSFMQRGLEELRRARRYKQPLSLLILDIDQFKNVNDAYGHEAGDLVLQQVALSMKDELREVDIIGRLGGDEFAVLLPNTPLDEAGIAARRLLQAIVNLSIRIPITERNCDISVSIGMAALEDQMIFIDDLIRKADAAMYRAKNSGGNQVCLNDET